jgi:hypothetical protein
MGDKTAARRAAIDCGVPIVPGTNQALQNVEEAKEFADKVCTAYSTPRLVAEAKQQQHWPLQRQRRQWQGQHVSGSAELHPQAAGEVWLSLV